MKGIRGKNVLVTGASSGIGQSIAIKLAEYGANVAINYYSSLGDAKDTEQQIIQQCRDSIQACGVNELLVQADVSNKNEVDRMFSSVLDSWGGLDILVNNAGIQIAAASHEMSMEQLDAVLSTNLRGAFICAQNALNHFLDADKSGIIINVSSVHQVIPKPQFIGYSMSKGGMQNLTRTLALEYAGRNIRVNAIAPGATVTPINDAWIHDEQKRAQVEQHIPMKRAGSSEEMAEVTAFLCSDYAAYMTGQTLFVDGGLTLYPDFREAWSSE